MTRNELRAIAKDCRKTVLTMIHEAGTSHIGSNFSCTEIMTVLYENILEKEDKFILSAGWKAATLYYFLARKWKLPKSSLKTYCKPGSKLIGLAEPTVEGVEFAGGSMGMGLAAGFGFALAKQIKREKGRVYVLESDGGMDCGMTWESALLAAHHKLPITLIVDANGLQAMGRKNDVLNIEPLMEKFSSFGWETAQVNGHDVGALDTVLSKRRMGPLCVVARTIKGNGVSWMEDENLWHYWHVDDVHYKKAMQELCR